MTESPFHAGELLVQERAGLAARALAGGRHGIRPFMPDEHRHFFAQLPFLIVGSLDAQKRPWASIMTGEPGFMNSPGSKTLRIEGKPLPGDPLAAHLKMGGKLGLLGIQLETRRRNRMNGHIAAMDDVGFEVAVDQSFGNCPQYIQVRGRAAAEEPESAAPRREGADLGDAARKLIAVADTFFIASAARETRGAAAGVDVSHRGGKPGFVHIEDANGATELTVPDFRGNAFFNTLGNLAANPVAGLLFVDFSTGNLLQLTGKAEILWDDPRLAAFAGAQRLWRVTVSEGLFHKAALPWVWEEPAYAPQLAATGSWEDVAKAAGL